MTRLLPTLVLLSGCPKPTPADAPGTMVTTPTASAPVVTAGRIAEGVYTDSRWPLTMRVPAGWASTIGSDGQEVRLVLSDPDADVRITVAVTPGDVPSPRQLPGCTWIFEDIARYRAVRVPEPVLVGTCTPEDPDAPRILTWVVAHDGVRWHIEGEVTPGRLRAAQADLETVLADVRFR